MKSDENRLTHRQDAPESRNQANIVSRPSISSCKEEIYRPSTFDDVRPLLDSADETLKQAHTVLNNVSSYADMKQPRQHAQNYRQNALGLEDERLNHIGISKSRHGHLTKDDPGRGRYRYMEDEIEIEDIRSTRDGDWVRRRGHKVDEKGREYGHWESEKFYPRR